MSIGFISIPDNPGIVGKILAFHECSTRLIKLFKAHSLYIVHKSPPPPLAPLLDPWTYRDTLPRLRQQVHIHNLASFCAVLYLVLFR